MMPKKIAKTALELVALLPPSIRIGAFDVEIKKESGGDDWGGYIDTHTIELCPGSTAPATVTHFLHEIGHAIYDIFGLKEGSDEEQTVVVFSSALTQIFRDNKWLLGWIRNGLGGKQHV